VEWHHVEASCELNEVKKVYEPFKYYQYRFIDTELSESKKDEKTRRNKELFGSVSK